MINIADLPAVRAQLERDAAAAKEQAAAPDAQAEQYVRAPVAGNAPPAAVQRNTR